MQRDLDYTLHPLARLKLLDGRRNRSGIADGAEVGPCPLDVAMGQKKAARFASRIRQRRRISRLMFGRQIGDNAGVEQRQPQRVPRLHEPGFK